MRLSELNTLANTNGLTLRHNGEQVEVVCQHSTDIVCRCDVEQLERVLTDLVRQHELDNALCNQ